MLLLWLVENRVHANKLAWVSIALLSRSGIKRGKHRTDEKYQRYTVRSAFTESVDIPPAIAVIGNGQVEPQTSRCRQQWLLHGKSPAHCLQGVQDRRNVSTNIDKNNV